jgi:hypothetical protein
MIGRVKKPEVLSVIIGGLKVLDVD